MAVVLVRWSWAPSRSSLGPFLFSPGSLNSQAKAAPLGGVTNHAAARQPLRRLPHGALELPDHGRQVRRLPRRRRLADQRQDRAARDARGDAFGTLRRLPPRPQRAERRAHLAQRGELPALGDRLRAHRQARHAAVQRLPHRRATSRARPPTATPATPRTTPTTARSGRSAAGATTPRAGPAPTSTTTSSRWTTAPTSSSPRARRAIPTARRTYTCYGCHFHTPQNVRREHEGQSAAALADCIKCHAGGKVPD